ncbi:putative membrane protein [Bacteroides fragilis str. S23L24]|nr:putative membrane protein [Bacteroides fragilis str. S23L24]
MEIIPGICVPAFLPLVSLMASVIGGCALVLSFFYTFVHCL